MVINQEGGANIPSPVTEKQKHIQEKPNTPQADIKVKEVAQARKQGQSLTETVREALGTVHQQSIHETLQTLANLSPQSQEATPLNTSPQEQPAGTLNISQEDLDSRNRELQQRRLILKDGKFIEVTPDQLTPEERADLFPEKAEPSAFEQNPLEHPDDFLHFLQQKNTNYDYQSLGISPQMVEKAVQWAQAHGFDPQELSPAQIVLSQTARLDSKTAEEEMWEQQRRRVETLRANREQLAAILAPTGNEFFHATPTLFHVEGIFEKGLYCNSRFGLNGSAVQLHKLPNDADAATIDQTTEANIQTLAMPHRGYQYEIVIELPAYTPEQAADYAARRSNYEDVSPTSYFVEKLPEQSKVGGYDGGYDAVLPTKYIKGFIDLDTGKFTPRQQQSK